MPRCLEAKELPLHQAGTAKATRLVKIVALVGAMTLSTCGAATAQQSSPAQDDTALAVNLSQQGQNEEAIRLLRGVVKRRKEYLAAWHYLALALEKTGDIKEASKAHENAAKLGDDLLTSRLNESSNKDEAIKAAGLIRNQLEAAANSGERFVALNPKLSGSREEEWEVRNYSLRGFANIETNPEIAAVVSSSQASRKPRVLSKPDGVYTEKARDNRTKGTVVLKAVFNLNGRVIRIHAVEGLPDGLTESAIQAARRLRFTPARKDGKPISVYVQLEYTFNTF
jgi:TonB family protein